MSRKCKEIEVKIQFLRTREKGCRDPKGYCWVEYSYPVTLCEYTIDEIVNQVVEQIVENFKKKFNVRDELVIMNYKEKVEKAVREAIEISLSRKLSRRLQDLIKKGDAITLKLVEALKGASKLGVEKYGKVRIGINTNRYPLFDFDRKSKVCLTQAFATIEFVYGLICKRCKRKAIIVETQRGFHLFIGLKLTTSNWLKIYNILFNERPFECLDYKHIALSIKRGYATLSVGKRKSYIKIKPDTIEVTRGLYERYRDVIEQYADLIGYKVVVLR